MILQHLDFKPFLCRSSTCILSSREVRCCKLLPRLPHLAAPHLFKCGNRRSATAGGFRSWIVVNEETALANFFSAPVARPCRSPRGYAATRGRNERACAAEGKREFAFAMERPLMAERIFVETGGSPSRRWSQRRRRADR
jgi:hypothetical protein